MMLIYKLPVNPKIKKRSQQITIKLGEIFCLDVKL